MAHVFLYGTLMRGGANHQVMRRLNARFCAPARTVDRRHLVDLGPYPALVPVGAFPSDSACKVHGEVWEVDDDALAELDAFEGCPRLYRREEIALRHAVYPTAFVYVLARPIPTTARLVNDGRYLRTGEVLRENAEEVALDGGKGDP